MDFVSYQIVRMEMMVLIISGISSGATGGTVSSATVAVDLVLVILKLFGSAHLIKFCLQ